MNPFCLSETELQELERVAAATDGSLSSPRAQLWCSNLARLTAEVRKHRETEKRNAGHCEKHGLRAEDHCSEMEQMLINVPADFLEGEGDTPSDAIEQLVDAYKALETEVAQMRPAFEAVERVRKARSAKAAALKAWPDDLPEGPEAEAYMNANGEEHRATAALQAMGDPVAPTDVVSVEARRWLR